jgi:HD-like signal output (HDOD) protein
MEKLTVERLKQANEIVKKIKLPVQPKIVIDINREASSDDPDLRKISALVGKDAGLTAKLLHVINSPFFGMSKEVTNIVQALSLMGMDNFKKVILTTCLREAIGDNNKNDQVFWDHSLRTAVAAEKIAKKVSGLLMIDNVTPDHAYITGLFHDSSIPVFIRKDSSYETIAQLALSHKPDMVQTEEDISGTDHCSIGAMLAKSWSLPTSICKAILHHHVNEYSTIKGDDPPYKLLAVIQLADYFAYTYDYSVGGVGTYIEKDWDTYEWSYYHKNTLDELDMTEEDVNELKLQIHDTLGE